MARVEALGSFDEDKRRLKLEQLAAQEDQRQVAKAQKRQDQDAAISKPDESVQAFLSSWQTDRDTITQHMADFDKLDVAKEPPARQAVKAQADCIIGKLFELERSVSSAAYFLPAFEIRNLSATAAQLRADMQKLQRAKLPRVPFAFSDPASLVLVQDPLLQGLKRRNEVHNQQAPKERDMPESAPVQHNADTWIASKRDTRIVMSAAQLKGEDWKLSDLQALYLENVQRCHIQAGPVGGATFGEQLHNCTLMLATHQLRLHNGTGMDVYVRPGSDPIIERCEGMRFASMPDLPYEGFAAALQTAALPADASHCPWGRVQDFQHPGHKNSPNWCVLPESDIKEAMS